MIELAGCVIRNQEGHILLLHRDTPTLVQWELPGGKVEEGENPAAAAIREVFEETGLTVSITNNLGSADFVQDGQEFTYEWLEAAITAGQPVIKEPDKFDQVAFRDLARLDKDTLSPNLINLIHEAV